jgi:hypothetical protein
MGSLEEILAVALREAKKRLKRSEFDTCRNLWILLHAALYLTPQSTKGLDSVIEIIDEEYRYCLYH